MSEPTEDPGLADATRWDATPLPGPARAAPVTGETTRLDGPLRRPPAEETPPPQPPPTTRWDRPADTPAAPPVDPDRTFWEEEAPAAAPPRYELLGELGRGGMGVVHRAREVATGREVALKLLTVDAGPARERLLREGQVTAALEHEHIVRVLGAGMLDGAPYLAYELVEGCRTLDQVLVDLPPAERARYVRDAARALGHAHARGVVHRDVKPHNLLVDAAGRLKVADFGVAAGVGLERLTLSGVHVGTPSYMAPEQVDARRDDVGPWTDVWALGVVLYVALTDRLPFVAPSFHALCMTIMDARPAAPRALAPDAPEALEAVCLRALAPRPADRYPDGAMARDLDRALGGADADALAAWCARRRARRALVAPAWRRSGSAARLLARLREQSARRPPPSQRRGSRARSARGDARRSCSPPRRRTATPTAQPALKRRARRRPAARGAGGGRASARRARAGGARAPRGRSPRGGRPARARARPRGALPPGAGVAPEGARRRAGAPGRGAHNGARGRGDGRRPGPPGCGGHPPGARAPGRRRARARRPGAPASSCCSARARLVAGDLDGAAADAARPRAPTPPERAAVAGERSPPGAPRRRWRRSPPPRARAAVVGVAYARARGAGGGRPPG
ncbi:MAG: serine/threonine protein kinase [Planctomycetes bacterium]|nr:serine/threonine protein kinase [Planctomycetota bacterium]